MTRQHLRQNKILQGVIQVKYLGIIISNKPELDKLHFHATKMPTILLLILAHHLIK